MKKAVGKVCELRRKPHSKLSRVSREEDLPGEAGEAEEKASCTKTSKDYDLDSTDNKWPARASWVGSHLCQCGCWVQQYLCESGSWCKWWSFHTCGVPKVGGGDVRPFPRMPHKRTTNFGSGWADEQICFQLKVVNVSYCDIDLSFFSFYPLLKQK